jgi:hypothetical protein
VANGRPGNPNWVKGVSGNPFGRPRVVADIQALARAHGPEAIRTLAECLKDPKHKVAAAIALLDRGFGKAALPVMGDHSAPLQINFRWADAAIAAPPEPTPNGDAHFASSSQDEVGDEIEIAWSSTGMCS